MRRDHLDPLDHRKAGIIGEDDEGREAARARGLARAREHGIDIGDAAVGDPGLLARRGCSSRPPPGPPWPSRRHPSRRPSRRARRRRSIRPGRSSAGSMPSAIASRRGRWRRCPAPAWRRRNPPARHARPASPAPGRAARIDGIGEPAMARGTRKPGAGPPRRAGARASHAAVDVVDDRPPSSAPAARDASSRSRKSRSAGPKKGQSRCAAREREQLPSLNPPGIPACAWRRRRRRRGGNRPSPCRSPAPAPRIRSAPRCPSPIPD